MFLAVSPNLLWQDIHFLNNVSPAAISPATATPAEAPSATIATETLFIILLDPFSCYDSKTKCREPMTPKRGVKGARTILLVAAAQYLSATKYRISGDFHS